MAAFDFRNKHSGQICDEFVALVDAKADEGDIRMAFDALCKLAYTQRYDVLERLQDKLIGKAQICGKAWADLTADPDAAASIARLALLDDLECLRPLAQSFVRIYSFNNKEFVKPWTSAIYHGFVPLAGRKNTEALAELFADTYDKLGGNDKPPSADAIKVRPATREDIDRILVSDGLVAAIDELNSCDADVRARIIDKYEQSLASKLRIILEVGENNTVEKYISMSNGNLADRLGMARFIAEAKGAAASPQLAVYIDGLASIIEGEPRDFSNLAAVFTNAAAHRTAVERQNRLRVLSKNFRKRPGL